MAHEALKWYDDNPDHPQWIKALADARGQATLEGYCYPHVQAIIVAIDQYAEAALGRFTDVQPDFAQRVERWTTSSSAKTHL